jgi:putative transposase
MANWRTVFSLKGSVIKTERISYRSFQKNFGAEARRSAAQACSSRSSARRRGNRVQHAIHPSVPVRPHEREYIKKPLSLRQHVFADGTAIQRDLYSAFLARFVEQDKLDARSAAQAFPAAKPLLERAASSDVEPASGARFPLPQVLRGLAAGRPLKRDSGPVEAKDAVAAIVVGESLGEIGPIASSEPPGFSRGEV